MNKGKGNFLFGLHFLPLSYKYSVEIPYIVFIHAENLLLHLCFVDVCLPFFCLSSLSLLCSSNCSINFESVCVCAACLSAAVVLVFLSFLGFVLFIGCVVSP